MSAADEPKWTRGPWQWIAEDKSVVALYGPNFPEDHVLWSERCPACQERMAQCTTPNAANRALIAAAPLLYEALEDAMELLSVPEHAQDEEWYERYHKIPKALAAARGEKP